MLGSDFQNIYWQFTCYPKKYFLQLIMEKHSNKKPNFQYFENFVYSAYHCFQSSWVIFVISGNRGNDNFFYNMEKRYKSIID